MAQVSWDTVPDFYKRSDGVQFDKDVLEEHLPARPEDKAEREAVWKVLDNNGSNSVSLAEFDSWFNKHFISVETKNGANPGTKSLLYTYGKPCFIRAFNLANGVSSGGGDKGDDFVTKDEFRLLMVATQAALIIYRLFDVADESDDRRVEQDEWDNQLDAINEQLTDFGYTGPAITSEDFSAIDMDGGGMILLNEAVVFFLDKFTNEKSLLAENEEEGAGAFSKQPSMKKQASVKKERRKSASQEETFHKHDVGGAGGGVTHFGDHHAHTGEMKHSAVLTEGGGRMNFPKSDAPDASYSVPGVFDDMKHQKPHAHMDANKPRFKVKQAVEDEVDFAPVTSAAFGDAIRIQKPHAATSANKPRFKNRVIMYGEPGMSDNKI
jgi:hypothetical protein